jgi:hypothetical protein
MLKVCFHAKQVDGLTASRQILTPKKDSIKPPLVLPKKTEILKCWIFFRTRLLEACYIVCHQQPFILDLGFFTHYCHISLCRINFF